MAYVREQQIRKGDKTYRYYQLVRGYRQGGKVKIEVLKHLGKHDSIEDARKAAQNVVTKEQLPDERERAFDKWAEKRARQYCKTYGWEYNEGHKEEMKRQSRDDWFAKNVGYYNHAPHKPASLEKGPKRSYVARLNAIRDELEAERVLYLDAQEEFFGAGGTREGWHAGDASQRNRDNTKKLHKKALKIYDSLSEDEQEWVMWEGRQQHGWHFVYEAQGARERAHIFGFDY